jgi:hypothetical protein
MTAPDGATVLPENRTNHLAIRTGKLNTLRVDATA